MTIRKGQDWGERVDTPTDLLVFSDDPSANAYLKEVYANGREPQSLAILKSNLARAFGLNGATIGSTTMLRTRLDLVEVSYVSISSQTAKMIFVGNAIIRNSWLRGPITGVFNSSFIGNWDCAPRAHPNDSKLDVVSIDQSMNVRQRLTAKRLVKLGSHLPHPKISYKQSENFKFDLQEPAHLFVDSIDLGMVRQCDFRVISDALTLYW